MNWDYKQLKNLRDVIPGASSAEQIASNVGASILNALTTEEMATVTEIYEKYIKASVHPLW